MSLCICCVYAQLYQSSSHTWKLKVFVHPYARVKVFRIIPEFRILRLTFHRVSLKILNSADYNIVIFSS